MPVTLTDFCEHARFREPSDEDTIRDFALDAAGMARTGKAMPSTADEWRVCFEAWRILRRRKSAERA